MAASGLELFTRLSPSPHGRNRRRQLPDVVGIVAHYRIDAAKRQSFNTDDMGHKIGTCISWLSAIHTLHPGDIVATGTNHRGLNPFMDGDTIELETEGLGRLKFGVKDDLKRSWARKTRLQMHEEAKEKTPGAYPDITPQLSGKYAK